MSAWTHNICVACYSAAEPGRVPTSIKPEYRSEYTCCYCGKKNRDGIFYRGNPALTPCKGLTVYHQEEEVAE